MLNSKLDLFGQNWIDTVFEGRNKNYGAYELRSKQSVVTIRAFFIGSALFALVISIPVISKYVAKNSGVADKPLDTQITMVDLAPPPVDDQIKDFVPPPPPPPEVKTLKDVKKFTPPVVAPETEVVEEIVTQKELEHADAGSKNVEGSADGEIVIDETPALVTTKPTVEQQITEEAPIIYQAVEVKPEYPGGMAAFYKYISQNFRVPEVSHDIEARVYVSFVVERDGSLTDIKILRDPGYGTGEEAVRVLKKMPKWKPGVQNGKNVRVAYQLPILIKLTAQ